MGHFHISAHILIWEVADMRYCSLRQKAVVNVIEGAQLGYISDIEIDECTGKVCSLIVPGGAGIRNIFQNKCYVIPWRNIVKIGDDVILVEADLNIIGTTR